jgi:hypothetical protein
MLLKIFFGDAMPDSFELLIRSLTATNPQDLFDSKALSQE